MGTGIFGIEDNVDTVGKNAKMIEAYIKGQLREDIEAD